MAIRHVRLRVHPPIRDHGATLGFDRIHPCVMVLLVRRYDLISLGRRRIGSCLTVWNHYRIDADFKTIPIGPRWRDLSEGETDLLVPHATGPDFPQLTDSDDALREFLQSVSHPDWLAQILNRQKRKWQESHPAKWFRLVPSEVPDREIPKCVRLAPDVALQFHQEKLSAGQIRHCIGRSFESGIRFAFQHLTESEVRRACFEFPRWVLTFHAMRLTADQLEICVRQDPSTAFRVRSVFPPRVQAKVLASTYMYPQYLLKQQATSEVREEILTSVIKFPRIWLREHNQSFHHLFEDLRRHLEITPDPECISRLMNNLPASIRKKLGAAVASMI
jgi:hypothetical protein